MRRDGVSPATFADFIDQYLVPADGLHWRGHHGLVTLLKGDLRAGELPPICCARELFEHFERTRTRELVKADVTRLWREYREARS
jgi:hypothetical protein